MPDIQTDDTVVARRADNDSPYHKVIDVGPCPQYEATTITWEGDTEEDAVTIRGYCPHCPPDGGNVFWYHDSEGVERYGHLSEVAKR